MAYVNHFFPREIYNTSRPRNFVARSVAARPHALKLASVASLVTSLVFPK